MASLVVGCLAVVGCVVRYGWEDACPQEGREQAGVRGRGLEGEDNLSPCLSLLEMADGLGGLGQRVSPVDHRYDLPGFGEFGVGGQVGLVGGRSRGRARDPAWTVPSGRQARSGEAPAPARRTFWRR